MNSKTFTRIFIGLPLNKFGCKYIRYLLKHPSVVRSSDDIQEEMPVVGTPGVFLVETFIA